MSASRKPDSKHEGLTRRTFLAGVAAAVTVAAFDGVHAQSPSVDQIPSSTRTFICSTARVLWAQDIWVLQAYRAIYKTSLPSMYSPLARPTGIVGAIVVESSALDRRQSLVSRNLPGRSVYGGRFGKSKSGAAGLRPICHALSAGPAVSGDPVQPLLQRGRMARSLSIPTKSPI